MEEDISNKTIVVLVVLTVIISVLSTMVVLNEVTNLRMADQREKAESGSSTGGKIAFTISEPPTSSSGRVIFNINAKK